MRQDLPFVETDEAFLVRADLVHVNVLIAGVDAFLDALDVPLRVGATGDDLGHRLLAKAGNDFLRGHR